MKSNNYKKLTLDDWQDEMFETFEDNQISTCLKICDRTLKLNENYIVAWYFKFRCFIYLEMHEEGIKYCNVLLKTLKEAKQSFVCFNDEKNGRVHVSLILLSKARACVRQKQYEDAIVACNEGFDVAKNSEFKEMIHQEYEILKSRCYCYLNKYDDAIHCLKTALHLDEHSEQAWRLMIECLQILNRWSDAFETIILAMKIFPSNSMLIFEMSYCLYNLEGFSAAIKSYNEAIVHYNPASVFHLEWLSKFRLAYDCSVVDGLNVCFTIPIIQDAQKKKDLFLHEMEHWKTNKRERSTNINEQLINSNKRFKK